jgi:nucleotide-binding universal stress UspA family protein
VEETAVPALDYRPFEKIRRVLVAVDASEAAREVLEYAAEVARIRDARLLCVHAVGGVTSPLGFVVPPRDPDEERAEARAYLVRFQEELEGVAVEIELVQGRVPDAILEVIARRDIDLLVMGTHGRTGLAKEMNRSVAETLVRLAPCPVLSIPVRVTV